MADLQGIQVRNTPPAARLRSIGWTAAVAAAFLVACTFVQFAVRLDYGPDEPYHLEYIHTLAFEHRLPRGAETQEAAHSPLYYAPMAVLWSIAGADQRPLSIPPGPAALQQMTGRSQTARRVLRFANSVIACVTLWVIARILAVIGIEGLWQTLLVLLVAAWPMFEYVSSVVNNENLSILYSAVVCLVLVSRVRAGTSTLRHAMLIGLLVGLAPWIKQTVLFAAPLALWVLWIAGDRQQRWARLGLFTAGVAALGIGWPLHNYRATGSAFPDFAAPADQAAVRQAALSRPGVLLQGFRACLETTFLPDWSRIFLPREVSTVIGVGVPLFLVGLVACVLLGRPDPRRAQLCVLSLTALVLLFMEIMAYAVWTNWRAWAGGRYLMSGAGWVAVLLGASLPWLRRSAEPGSRHADQPAAVPIAVPTAVLLLVLASASWWHLANIYFINLESAHP